MFCLKCNHKHCGTFHGKLVDCTQCPNKVWLCKDEGMCDKDGDTDEDAFHCHNCYPKDISTYICPDCIYKNTEK